MLKVQNITKIYIQGNYCVEALNGLSFDFPETGFVTVTGESGCGKTTLLNILSGLDTVTEGKICIDGKETTKFTANEWNEYRNKTIGIVFQDFNVFDELTVRENISLPLEICTLENEDEEELIGSVMKQMGISDKADQSVRALSGGQKQRVALCRALVKKPRILLADEPTGNLDAENSDIIFELIKKIAQDTLIIMVTHDRARAEKYSDICIEMVDGAISNVVYPAKYDYVIEVTEDNEKHCFDEYNSFDKFIKKSIYEQNEERSFSVVSKRSPRRGIEKSTSKIINKHTKSLSNQDVKRFSDKILIKRKTRQKITAVAFSLCFLLLLCTVSIMFYSEKMVNRLYVNQYQCDTAFYLRADNYLYADSGIDDKNISCTSYIEEELKSIAGTENVFYRKDFGRISTGGKYIEGEGYSLGKSCEDIYIYVISDYEFNMRTNLAGDTSEVDGCGIIITDYMADQLEVSEKNLGDIMYLDGINVKLCGITPTDYKTAVSQLKTDDNADYYTKMSVYSAVYVNEAFKNEKKAYYLQHRLVTENNNIFAAITKYYLDCELIFSFYDADSSILVAGRAPEKINEIVVSESVAVQKKLFDENGEFTPKSYSVIDIYDDKYQKNFDDDINYYNYIGDTVNVVGVVNDNDCEVYFTYEAYEKMVEDYVNLYEYDEIGLIKKAALKYKTKLINKGYFVADDNLYYSKALMEDNKATFSYALFYFLVIVILMALLMLTQIRYEIKDNYKNIGVFKALGVENKDIRRIFMRKPRTMVVYSIAAGTLIFGLYLTVVNFINFNDLGYRKYVSVITDWKAILAAVILVFAYGLLLAWLPIKEVGKKNVIGIIKS